MLFSQRPLPRIGRCASTKVTLTALFWLICTSLALASTVTYTVKSGDNPWTIADKFSVSLDALLETNQFGEDVVLQVGQKITIPTGAEQARAAAAQDHIEYSVVAGDTLGEIAEAHQVSLAELLQTNGLTSRSMLQVGLVLKIPVDDATAGAEPNLEPVNHTLTSGESLWIVARHYGVDVGELARANRVGLDQVLNVGKVLVIPGVNAEIPTALPADDIDPTAPIGGPVNLLALDGVPESGAPEQTIDGNLIHTVQPGDTVSHLAVKYRTTRAAIFAANNLGTRDLLTPGQIVKIPVGSLDRERTLLASAQERIRSDHGLPSRDTTVEQRIVKFALQYLGTPYRWAGSDLQRGVDCSGYVMAVYSNFGVSLPHSSKSMATVGERVRREDLRPGDIILFHTTRRGISHAGLYIGEGQFVHASTNQKKVRIDSLSEGYYDRAYVTARRVL